MAFFKGQASLELMITLGIVLAFSVPVLFLLLSVTSFGYENTSNAQAEASSRLLAEAMNLVYAQGEGAKRVVLLNVPSTTEQVYAANGEVVVVTKSPQGASHSSAWPTIAKLPPTQGGTPSTPLTRKGLYPLVVFNNHGVVELIDPNLGIGG